jgi:CRISPR system Cascade subunit CasB
MNKQTTAAAVAAHWWRGLQPYKADGTPNPVADRAALARLRRSDLIAAMEDPATFDLFRQLEYRDPRRLVDVALCAGVLAVVREDNNRAHAARQLGVPSDNPNARPVMSDLRFRRLVAAETPEERLIALRRAVLLAGAAINVRDVAAACLDWSDTRRRRWLFQYHDVPDQPGTTGATP